MQGKDLEGRDIVAEPEPENGLRRQGPDVGVP